MRLLNMSYDKFDVDWRAACRISGYSHLELKQRSITINRVPPSQIARLRRCDLLPAFRPTYHGHPWLPVGSKGVSGAALIEEFKLDPQLLDWLSIHAGGMRPPDLWRLRQAGLFPYWYATDEDSARYYIRSQLPAPYAPEDEPHEGPGYRGFWARYCQKDLAKSSYDPPTCH